MKFFYVLFYSGDPCICISVIVWFIFLTVLDTWSTMLRALLVIGVATLTVAATSASVEELAPSNDLAVFSVDMTLATLVLPVRWSVL